MLSESEWISGSESGYIDTEYLKKNINCYDESALELSCRFADQCSALQLTCTCTAVTAGDRKSERFLETLAAVGFRRTARIQLDNTAKQYDPSPEYLAALLFSYIKKQDHFDLIVTGAQSADGNQGKIPLLLAELLHSRCITQVQSFVPTTARHILVSYYRDDFLCKEEISGPAVFAIGNSADTYLRVPTLKQRMNSKKQPVTLYKPEDLYDSEIDTAGNPAVTFRSMEANIQQRKAIVIDKGTPEEKAAILYNYYKKWVQS